MSSLCLQLFQTPSQQRFSNILHQYLTLDLHMPGSVRIIKQNQEEFWFSYAIHISEIPIYKLRFSYTHICHHWLLLFCHQFHICKISEFILFSYYYYYLVNLFGDASKFFYIRNSYFVWSHWTFKNIVIYLCICMLVCVIVCS